MWCFFCIKAIIYQTEIAFFYHKNEETEILTDANDNRNFVEKHAPISQKILDREHSLLKNKVSNFAGYRFMSLGANTDSKLIETFNHSHKFCIDTLGSQKKCNTVSLFSDLPLPSEAIDCVLLQHILEFSEQPQSIISEVSRVINSGGHLFIFIVNPISVLGLKKLIAKKMNKSEGSIYYPLRIKRITDWLHLLNFEVKAVVKDSRWANENLCLNSREKDTDTTLKRMGKFAEYGESLINHFYLIHGVKRNRAGIRVPKVEWSLSAQNKLSLDNSISKQPRNITRGIGEHE